MDLATRAADRVVETGKMLQLEPMPALERRWIHLALRDNAGVSTQSIGEEPNRRVVVLPRNVWRQQDPASYDDGARRGCEAATPGVPATIRFRIASRPADDHRLRPRILLAPRPLAWP